MENENPTDSQRSLTRPENHQLTCTLSWREGSLDARELVTLRRQLLDDLGVEAPAPT